ncbi:5762_t:CDS:2 [Ambispora leptoticha]|uniref:5762_t:CDS:1 n=1 Tax=Ambispora leptoticha TaxID=144679 RepID=A0A9N8YKK1_9GLOM|nr:5762_t:CDS:2 [Ambispora leptoticha]
MSLVQFFVYMISASFISIVTFIAGVVLLTNAGVLMMVMFISYIGNLEIEGVILALKYFENNDKSIANYQEKNDFFQRVPKTVILNIFSFLKPKDLFSFAKTSRHLHKQLESEDFWEFICKKQFDPLHIEDVQNTLRKIKEIKLILAEETYETILQAIENEIFEWKFLYKKLSFMCRYISYESHVADYDNPENWTIVNSEESEFGQYYHLTNISCLQVHEVSTIGEYIDFPKEFIKPLVPGQKLISILKEKGDWVEYCLPVQARFVPQEVSIPDIPTTFHLRCKIFEGNDVLKSGLSIDYVRLRYHNDQNITSNESDDSEE